jgi:hypothetical protein
MPAGHSSRSLATLEHVALVSTRALSVLGLFALMVLAFITLANGLLRWLINQPIAGVVDVGALAIAIAVACCIPVSLMERSHITFRLVSSISPRLGRWLDVFADIAVVIVLVLMAWQFWVMPANWRRAASAPMCSKFGRTVLVRHRRNPWIAAAVRRDRARHRLPDQRASRARASAALIRHGRSRSAALASWRCSP